MAEALIVPDDPIAGPSSTADHIPVGHSSVQRDPETASSRLPRPKSRSTTDIAEGRRKPRATRKCGQSERPKQPTGSHSSKALPHQSTATKPSTHVTREEFTAVTDKLSSMSGDMDNITTMLQILIDSKNKTDKKEKEGGHDEDDDSPLSDPGLTDDDDGLSYFQEVAGVAETTGPDVNPTIAKGVSHMLKMGLTENSRSNLHKKYLVPANCLDLQL